MTEGLQADAAARVRAAVPETATATVDRLVRDYLEVAEPHDLAVFTGADVAGAILSVLGAGEAAIQVGNPEAAVDGWESPHTVVQIVTEDLPFVVDSVSTAIVRRGYDIHLLFHPLVDGRSHLHVEIDRETDTAMLEQLRHELTSVIVDVRAAVGDWAAMRARVIALADGLRQSPPFTVDAADAAEAATYLEWLADDHFTLVGAVDAGLDGRTVAGSELGVARVRSMFRQEPATNTDQPFVLTLTKSLERSTVHRDVPLDFVGVRQFGTDGRVVGETRFLGLYTANVYSQSVAAIPLLRRKAEQVFALAGFAADGHDGRALTHVLETSPRDELFRLSVRELTELAVGIVSMGQRRRVRLFVSRDEQGCFVSCLVYLPRDRYTTQVRVRIVDALQRAFGGSDVDYTALVTESVMARLHVVVSTADGALDADVVGLEAELGRMVRDWTDDLRDAFVEARGEERGLDGFRDWMHAFPAAYQFDVPAPTAVADLAILEELDVAGGLEIRLVPPTDGQVARIKLYRSGSALVLSDVMPLLEHLGVTVVDERPYEITAPDGEARWIYSFGVRALEGDPLSDPDVQTRVAAVFLGVWAGTIESDGLNRLVLGAGLTARDVVIVRALCQYLRQAGVRFTDAYLADTLAANPEAVRLTVALFHARLDPDRARDAAHEVERITADLVRAIDAVMSLDADRILRSLCHLVLAIVRTNAYLPRDYLAVKFDPELLDFLPAPRPHHEIWVASPQVEGVHLRAGAIARGGIRWSDRREDFRTEVLGLMKAQTVKNAVIVPVGAKGGFVVKRSTTLRSGTEPADRAAVQAGYRTFIRGLLDLTDTLADGRVVPPTGVVRHDGDDTYLVVAADKGTGAFSDVANELAAEYGYWLGDAFASGGSSGFDHKEMGITSRGAWISVLAHFRSLGVDADTASLTVVGIGDMSGDVFGNGLLRSRHVRLVAAFDHRHVFVDPDPDPETSFVERQRLFALPTSSWADYDPACLSPGAGIYERSAKSVSLSTEARGVLGVEAGTLTPDELVSAVLRAPVDLLWNGGIGTFVKATTESDLDVGDRTNDAVRIDAPELRCQVVAEGGNLGFTQRARIEFALGGGRINTDAIDNSAGVDCSDHEVNIKILLQRAIATGAFDATARDALLAHMTDAVADLVLADNAAQANALEIAAVEAATLVGVHARQMERLEQTAGLDRVLEALPSAKVLQERHAAGQGLTSPELAVLLAYTKLELQHALVASDVPDDPYLHDDFVAYFPSDLRAGYDAAMASHPLRREIVATVTANAVVNRAGISFLSRLTDETGMPLPLLARAHVIARDVHDASATWSAIDALDLTCSAATQDEMFLTVRRLVERAARWLVRHADGLTLGPTIEEFGPGVRAVVAALPVLLTDTATAALTAEVERLQTLGVPEVLARRVAGSEAAVAALPAVELAQRLGTDPLVVARMQFVVNDRLALDPLREHVAALPRADRWQTEARAALRDDLSESQHALTEAIVRETDAAAAPDDRVATWLTARAADVGRFRQVVADVEAAGGFDLAALAVARRALRELAGLD